MQKSAARCLPNLSAVVTFVGGPWDGLKTDWGNKTCPEYVTATNADFMAIHAAYKYRLCVRTNTEQQTNVFYIYEGKEVLNEYK
jgi:hypothetical protein